MFPRKHVPTGHDACGEGARAFLEGPRNTDFPHPHGCVEAMDRSIGGQVEADAGGAALSHRDRRVFTSSALKFLKPRPRI